jgi:hypothetical protein
MGSNKEKGIHKKLVSPIVDSPSLLQGRRNNPLPFKDENNNKKGPVLLAQGLRLFKN